MHAGGGMNDYVHTSECRSPMGVRSQFGKLDGLYLDLQVRCRLTHRRPYRKAFMMQPVDERRADEAVRPRYQYAPR